MYLQYRLWFSQHGLLYYSSLQNDVVVQEKSNEQVEECNKLLKQEIVYFRNSPDALEERARYQLDMIKKGEVFVSIDDNSKPSESKLDQCTTLQ